MHDQHADAQSAPQNFDTIPFIHDGASQRLRFDPQYPYLCNIGGRGSQTQDPLGVPVEIKPKNPDLSLGTRYEHITGTTQEVHTETGSTYFLTTFNFGVNEVRYEALPATEDTARAFGMTLLPDGKCVRFMYDNMIMAEYSYGKWAGYQSPYIGKARNRELLTINATDLEYHAFPHVFFSHDTLPLVISVARWRPYVNEICLADLWLEPKSALVLPPQFSPDPAPPGASATDLRKVVVDLHGNRNSALACRFVDGKPMLHTTTILANDAAFADPKTKPFYYREPTATYHPPGPPR